MKLYSAPIIPDRWRRPLSVLLLAAASLGVLAAQNSTAALKSLVLAHKAKPSGETRAALVRFAAEHPRDNDGALALLALAQCDLDGALLAEVPARAAAAQARLPKLADYAAFLHGSALNGSGQSEAAMRAFGPVFAQIPKSPLISRAASAYAEAAIRSNQPQKALELLKRHWADLQQPAGELALAKSFEASRDFVSAANYYQRVYNNSPESRESLEAESSLPRMKQQLGDAYPTITPAALLARATKLIESGQAARARRDLEAILPTLGGADRELAMARIGWSILRAGDVRSARNYLGALKVTTPEADAERLSYLAMAAVRADDTGDAMRALDQAARKNPRSPARLEALLAVGNHYFLKLNPGAYGPLYEQCVISFRQEQKAGICGWRAALAAYKRDRASAADLLRTHIRTFPGEEHVAGALFHLGQIAERKGDWGSARVLYQDVEYSYANFYYAYLSRERLKDPRIQRAAPSPDAAGFLASVTFPKRRFTEDFRATPTTAARSERMRLLLSAGLDYFAEIEARFGGRTDSQTHLLAMDMANEFTERGQPSKSIRWMKALAPNYLKMPIETAPRDFWKLLFPLPWRGSLELYATEQGLDPFLVAGLIRQESEFDHAVVSHSYAHGLMQIMPGTGSELNRQVGLRGYSRLALFDPTTNLRLGTFYLNNLLKRFNQRWEETLASYNAGPGRVRGWLEATPPQVEPWEWVESIPFNETRGYVQSVLRNADTYRQLYAKMPGDSTPAPSLESLKPATPPPAPARAARPAAKKPTARATTPAKKRSTGRR